MSTQQGSSVGRRSGGHRKKAAEGAEFDGRITARLDSFFREFNYSYPGKNKQEIVNKCMIPGAYWMTVDSVYFPQFAHFERERIEQFRHRQSLKNGVYPPTKDALEEEKFILLLRRLTAHRQGTRSLEEIQSAGIPELIDCLEKWLLGHEVAVSGGLDELERHLGAERDAIGRRFWELRIDPAPAARLFEYERLEREVIDSSIFKAEQKQREPACDFCFLREKDLLKCITCDLHTHPSCFQKTAKLTPSSRFQCDRCAHDIPRDAQCELCPIENGHMLELAHDGPVQDFTLSRGDGNLKLKISRRVEPHERRRLFIHVSCFVLHSDCSYNVQSSRVEGFHLIDRSRKSLGPCGVCGCSVGQTVGCNNETCRRCFHPECAKRANLAINVIKAHNKALLEIYCERHKKPESYEVLRESVVNRVKDLRKFYESLDHEIKRHGSAHTPSRPKKQLKIEELLKADKCLSCERENDNSGEVVNCRRCYGWHHFSCCDCCPNCDK